MSPKRIVWGCWLLVETGRLKENGYGSLLVLWNRKISYIQYDIQYEWDGKAGVLCIYGMWMLHTIGGIDREDGWNSGGGWDECLMWIG